MRKVDSDRIQSFHMQALRRILGIRWYDKVSNAVVNERTKLPDYQLTDVIHYLVTICRLPENTPASQALQLSIEAWAGCGPIQVPPRCTKCNSPPINGQCTNFILFDTVMGIIIIASVHQKVNNANTTV